MKTINPETRGHSADVQIELYLNGSVLQVAQLGPDFLILKSPIDHPPSQAEISLSIDGKKSRWPVQLVDGIAVGERKTRIAR